MGINIPSSFLSLAINTPFQIKNRVFPGTHIATPKIIPPLVFQPQLPEASSLSGGVWLRAIRFLVIPGLL
jgi:hypothetical protein